jgi:mRNA deadenylase 3'-5' endonuclease subunit Ccr4
VQSLQIRGTPKLFIDTLDYIFLSPQWSVQEVPALPHRDGANGPFPNENEPSDHLLIAAELTQ